MSTEARSRGTLAVALIAALMVAALAAASQAQASTLYACVKKNGSAKVYTKKPKCKKGEKLLSWNTVGPAGKTGEKGANGNNGSNGANGAVAGFGAQQTTELNFTEDGGLTQVPGLTKTLPAGSFVASGNVEVDVSSEKAGEVAAAECEMADVPTSGASTTQLGRFASQTSKFIVIFFEIFVTDGEIPFHFDFTTTTPSTLSIKCSEVGHSEHVTMTAVDGGLVAVQTSANS